MIKLIFRIISVLLLYLTASNYINFQSFNDFWFNNFADYFDLYTHGLKIKISIQTISSLILLIILYLVNPYSLYISILLFFLSLKPRSNSRILLNYTYASCLALLIIGIISLLIFDVTYSRYLILFRMTLLILLNYTTTIWVWFYLALI